MDSIMLQELYHLVYSCLSLDCPVLTGNMKSHISYGNITPNKVEIVISGPSFDEAEYEKTGKFVYTNEYDYAISVNRLGAFGGRSKKSQYWVNKSLVKSCSVIAEKYGAELIVYVKH